MKKALLAFILILLVAAYLSDIGRFLSLDYLKSEQESLQLLISNNFFETVLAFFAVYVVTTALSIPGAAILTIAAGALFGLTTGLIIVSFASTIGATCAFLISCMTSRIFSIRMNGIWLLPLPVLACPQSSLKFLNASLMNL